MRGCSHCCPCWAAELSGPVLGGFLVGAAKTTVAGAMLAYLIQGVMQLLSAISLMTIRRNLEVQTGERPGLLREVREGSLAMWPHQSVPGWMSRSWLI